MITMFPPFPAIVTVGFQKSKKSNETEVGFESSSPFFCSSFAHELYLEILAECHRSEHRHGAGRQRENPGDLPRAIRQAQFGLAIVILLALAAEFVTVLLLITTGAFDVDGICMAVGGTVSFAIAGFIAGRIFVREIRRLKDRLAITTASGSVRGGS